MKLSPNFSLAEFTKSDTATRRQIANIPNALQTAAIRTLCLSASDLSGEIR